VDVVDGPCSFRTLPALVASDPTHLPTKCLLLLGVPQLNELNIKLDTHRKFRRLPLESYDPSIDFSADTHLQCRMSDKDLLAWAEHNKEAPVGYTLYSHLDVVYDVDTLSAEELRQLRAASATYRTRPLSRTPCRPHTPRSPRAYSDGLRRDERRDCCLRRHSRHPPNPPRLRSPPHCHVCG
jgi:hypothetical protein